MREMLKQMIMLQMQIGWARNYLDLSEKSESEGPINKIVGMVLHSIGLTKY